MPILALERPGAGVVSLQIWIPAGSRMESQKPGSGLAHFLEHMVFKGTASRSALEINREAERCGGFLNAYTSFDRTVYHIDLPADRAVDGFDLLADFVWNPTLAVEGFAAEREVILREIAMVRDDPDSHLFDTVCEAAFREDLLRYPVIGLEERFCDLTIDDLRGFHQQQYRSRSMFLLLAGDLRPELLQRAGEVLPPIQGEPQKRGAVQGGSRFESPAPVHLRIQGSWEGGRGIVMLLLPTMTLREMLLAEWMVETLAGGESSRLDRILRIEREWVHCVDGFLEPVEDHVIAGFSWLAEGEHLQAVEAVVRDELCRVASDLVPAEAAERAKKRLRFARIRQDESVEGWASRSGEFFRSLGRVPEVGEELAILDLLEREELREFAQRHVRTDSLISGQLHPRED